MRKVSGRRHLPYQQALADKEVVLFMWSAHKDVLLMCCYMCRHLPYQQALADKEVVKKWF